MKRKFNKSKEYVLKCADNCINNQQRLYAQVVTVYEPRDTNKMPLSEIEVYNDPDDFVEEMTHTLKGVITDELIEKQLMSQMNITIIIDYEYSEDQTID